MKNTIRVHRNGDTQTASAQTKISRAKQPSAQTVHIILNDENGKEWGDFDIPKFFYAAMIQAAKRNGITLQQWIETAVRNRLDAMTRQQAIAATTGGAK
jgi:hypothetical protein